MNSEKSALSRRGLMLVLSSPSGAGKTTISRAMLERDSNLTMSVSATTRPKRSSEVDGKDYIFVDEEKFKSMIDGGELLEHANVFGNFYGTPKKPVEEASLIFRRSIYVVEDIKAGEALTERNVRRIRPGFGLPPKYFEKILGQVAKVDIERGTALQWEYIE